MTCFLQDYLFECILDSVWVYIIVVTILVIVISLRETPFNENQMTKRTIKYEL